MTNTPNAPTWPRHPAHKADENERQLNPASSSLTDSQAREFAEESGTCSDGTVCGTRPIEHFCEDGYCNDCPNQPKVPQCLHYNSICGEGGHCAPCPNRPQPQYDPNDVAFKSVDAHYQHHYKGIMLDPYRIAAIYNMQGGPREHIMKKCLRFTDKGQSEQQVVNEIRNALNRWQTMLDEDAAS